MDIKSIVQSAVILDFETYYKDIKGDTDKFSLRQTSIPEFVSDKRFKVHGVAILDSEAAAFRATDVGRCLRGTIGLANKQGAYVVMHNAKFDDYILQHVYGLKADRIICTQQLAHAVLGSKREFGASLGLGALAERFGLEAKGDLEAIANGKEDLTDEEAERLAEYAINDVRITGKLLEILLSRLSCPEMELWIAQHTIRLFTDPARGVRIDLGALKELRKEFQDYIEEEYEGLGVGDVDLSGNLAFKGALEAAMARAGRKLPMKAGKNGSIPALARTDKAMQELCEDKDPTISGLCKARLLKKSEELILARLDTMEKQAKACKKKIPVYLNYCGSITGRFSGGGSLNFQNMGRSGWQGRIRGLVRPPKGKVFVIADASQIEARVLAYYANEEKMVSAFASGRDIYKEFAGEIFDDFEIDAIQRFVGKKAVLGLGYGMGSKKFLDQLQAETETDLSPLFESDTLGPLPVRRIVETYRTLFWRVPMLWASLEEDLRHALNGVSVMGTFEFKREPDGCFAMVLPSGRLIRYHGLRLEERMKKIEVIDKNGQLRFVTMKGPALVYGQGFDLYGGLICENAIQGIARDILCAAIKQCELEAGIPILFHVHDEVVASVPEKDAESAVEYIETALSTAPSWAPGLPLAAEASIAERYGKGT